MISPRAQQRSQGGSDSEEVGLPFLSSELLSFLTKTITTGGATPV